MTQPRLSTVYDFADLRLHPDGTRVYQKTSNLRPHLVKTVTQNSRFNWIAKDAGGSGTVPKFRKRGKASTGEDEDKDEGEISQAEEEENAEVSQYSSEEHSPRLRKKRKPKRIDTRKPKRLKFARDDSYLAPELPAAIGSTTEPPEVQNNAISLPEPSADLLKCIHRFASEFYTERGQLLNTSRQYRKEKKERALLRQARRDKRASRVEEDSEVDTGSDSEPPELGSGDESETRSVDKDFNSGQESEGGSESTQQISPKKKGKGKWKAKVIKPWKRKGRRRAEKLYTDMYKMFDGSAIMALGMLVQEQIAHMLDPRIPEGWEEEMKAYYGASGQDDHAEEEVAGASTRAIQGLSFGENRGIIIQDRDADPRVSSHVKHVDVMTGLGRSDSENSARQSPGSLISQSAPGTSADDENIGPTNDDDPIRSWSEEPGSNEDSDGSDQEDND